MRRINNSTIRLFLFFFFISSLFAFYELKTRTSATSNWNLNCIDWSQLLIGNDGKRRKGRRRRKNVETDSDFAISNMVFGIGATLSIYGIIKLAMRGKKFLFTKCRMNCMNFFFLSFSIASPFVALCASQFRFNGFCLSWDLYFLHFFWFPHDTNFSYKMFICVANVEQKRSEKKISK